VPSLTFRARHRLTHARQFQAVQRRGVKRVSGPVQASILPNDLPHWRLGLSIGRRLGGAVQRNAFKRLLREAFRLSQHELPTWTQDSGTGTRQPAIDTPNPNAESRMPNTKPSTNTYDVVLALRPHDPLTLDEYRALLLELAHAAHREWERRRGKGT